MEQTDGRDDSEEEAPSSNSSNGATQRTSSPRKRALRLYSSDQSDVVKSNTPTPQDEEQTNIPSMCTILMTKLSFKNNMYTVKPAIVDSLK